MSLTLDDLVEARAITRDFERDLAAVLLSLRSEGSCEPLVLIGLLGESHRLRRLLDGDGRVRWARVRPMALCGKDLAAGERSESDGLEGVTG